MNVGSNKPNRRKQRLLDVAFLVLVGAILYGIFTFVSDGGPGSEGPGGYEVTSPAPPVADPAQDTLQQVVDFVAGRRFTPKNTERLNERVADIVTDSGCVVLSHDWRVVETEEAAVALLAQVDTGVSAAYARLTWGDFKGSYYMVAARMVCDGQV